MRQTAFAILFTAVLSACSPAPDAATPAGADAAPIPQHLQILIDGKPLAIDPDRPLDGQVATASVVNGRLAITALDKTSDNMLVVEAPISAEPKAGEFLSYQCKVPLGCDEPQRDGTLMGTMLHPAPTTKQSSTRLWQAYKAPKLNLQPATLKLEMIEPVYWPGVGPAWRIKGTFRGTLADAVEDWSNPRINGPVRLLEGNFDMYAQRY